MDGIVSIIIAVITTVGVLGAAYLGGRRYRGEGSVVPSPNEAALRMVADTAKAEAEIWKNKYEAVIEECARSTAISNRKIELLQHDADECERKLNALYAELRTTGHVQDRRSEPRED